ncbi:pimeloyl-ACP methyl ester carboxylesterase [Asanoa ferruginea]|uniref:Pimeloyl-ACP methyl ester carboxylesterase n=1 Tax=Asanoa ferruginea TaxID=53367 RepID=A0A3E0A2Z4_9ACTN|nr:alpha/beta hydrolase [Asanoa ferruginea]REG00691.1 pimeloyl-ACP methyl ester carboxylesterase [Asanoa ferruginea]GIF47436.1 alpha/beta hydrolase [Asanoa ferruginea]
MSDTAGLAAVVEGSGPPVVLVHSGVADHRSWDRVAAVLVATHTVIRYDLRGFGATPPPTEGFRHRDDLAALLDGLGIERAAIVGNSFGGYVSLEFATRWPERVTHLGLLASSLDGRDWGPEIRAYGAAEGKLLDADDIDGALALNLDMWARGPVREWSPELRALADELAPAMRISLANQQQTESFELPDDTEPPSTRLDVITAPTLVAVGESDVPDFVVIARLLADTIAGARLLELPGAGHVLPVERPKEITAAVLELLAR